MKRSPSTSAVPTRARLLSVAALAVACLAGPARAGDTPIVSILPGVLTPADPAGSPRSAEQRLDRPLPASRLFQVQVPVGQDVEATGVLYVWPAVVQACDAKEDPPASGPQTYALGMQLTPTPQGRALSAKVPPLQVGQAFCLLARTQVRLSLDQVAGMVRRVAATLADRFDRKYLAPRKAAAQEALHGSPRSSKLDSSVQIARTQVPLADREQPFPDVAELRPELAAAFGQEIERQTQVPADARGVRKAAWAAADGFLISAGHLKLRSRARAYQAVADRQAELSGKLEATKQALTARPPLAPLSSPVVFHEGVLIAVLDLLQADVKLSALDEAVAQLAARAADADAAWAKPWHAELDKIAAELKTTAASEKGIFLSTAAADLTEMVREAKIPPPGCLDMWDAEQKKLVCLSSFQRDPVFFDAAFAKTVAAQVDALASDWAGPAAEQVRGWLGELTRIVELSQEIEKNAVRLEKAAKGLEATRAEARADFEAAFASQVVSGALSEDLRQVGVDLVGQGTVPHRGNYASLDLGIGLGWPIKGQADGPNFLPTIGVNIYLAPVDRVVPLGQLVGDDYDVWLQRLSLTVGISLTQPDVSDRKVKPMLLQRYPFAALGYRTSHFMRVVLGVAFYKLLDANPASAARELGYMPFVGVSLDADLVHLFGEAVGR